MILRLQGHGAKGFIGGDGSSNGNLPPFGGGGGDHGKGRSDDNSGGRSGEEGLAWHRSLDWKEKRQNETDIPDQLRGGGGRRSSDMRSSNKNNAPQASAETVMKGAQATLSSSASYWSRAFRSLTSTITKPFKAATRSVSGVFTSKEKKVEQELLRQLQTLPIRHVTVPNSTVLPQDVVQLAAKRSGVLGNPLQTDSVQDFARAVQRWYRRKGYILHSVTGATLKPETATAEIEVQEPMTSHAPVWITFCKEMVVDQETGELLTFRQYRDKHTARRTLGFHAADLDKKKLNTTLVPTTGRTNPSKIASALRLQPGSHFQWDGSRWQRIVQSGIFKNVLRASPQPMRDGTVQLHIVAIEAPARHLEYGLGRSLYTGSWEGEMEFEHGNLLGGGETLGVKVKRGTQDARPSVRLSFSDNRFGIAGGYDVEVFSDYLGSQKALVQTPASKGEDKEKESESEESVASSHGLLDELEQDAVLDRRGATVRLRFPSNAPFMRSSMASASVERTSTKFGNHENIGSSTLKIGPFVKELPYDARSNVDFRVTTGTRLVDREPVYDEVEPNNLLSKVSFLPFASATATTRQVFPLIAAISPQSRRPLTLALHHSLTASSENLPRHEAIAQGHACNIRGAKENGRVASCLQGTTELRVPVDIPIRQTRQDGSVVVFGDWLLATEGSNSPFYKKTCFGVGLRKSIQGFPLQFDVTYSKDLKLKTSIGLGRDFDV